ncbi:hypothetical protein BDR03DRAFT_981785 [Suillus americanus]|nr:hypothetical protein BDR03DRAFT_981785 [Suillus americanus]
MSPPVVADIPQDAASSNKSQGLPRGWTDKLIYPEPVEEMFNYSTGLKATFELAEQKGSRYIFSLNGHYYIWNTVSEQGWRILNAKNHGELYNNIAMGKGGLKLEELPDFGSDLED